METPSASAERAAAVAADRLGDLPDGVLLEVLSSLTFRQAVRTGVLSRRWRGLWHAVPYPPSCIDIDLKRAFRGDKATRWSPPLDAGMEARKRRCDEEWERRYRLEDYGDLVTTTAGAGEPLGAFRLRVDLPLFQTAGGRWIRRVLTRGPMAVFIRCDAAGSLRFPQRPEFSFAGYPNACTSRIRELQLHEVTLGLGTWRDFVDAMASDLPVLEDLRLEACNCYFTQIASTSLQNLAICNCTTPDQSFNVLAIAAPRLASLRIRGNPPPVASECEMPCLLAASLEHPAGFAGLLSSLRHARNLSLYGFATTALLDADDAEEPGGLLFPEFRNLSALVLDECDVGVDCQVLRRFLRNSPGLETLALRYCSFEGGSRRKKRKARSSDDRRVPTSDDRRVPTSYACRNLKSVELKYHDDQDVYEIDDVLEEISKKVARPIESSVQHGRRTVRISYR